MIYQEQGSQIILLLLLFCFYFVRIEITKDPFNTFLFSFHFRKNDKLKAINIYCDLLSLLLCPVRYHKNLFYITLLSDFLFILFLLKSLWGIGSSLEPTCVPLFFITYKLKSSTSHFPALKPLTKKLFLRSQSQFCLPQYSL
jgi:hypothetical protein